MKSFGWTLIVLGILSFVGRVSKRNSPLGPLFCGGVGVYLVHRGKQKEKEKRDMDDWNRGE